MGLCLFRQRSIWWPTWFGWAVLLCVFGAPAAIWCLAGEQWLSRSDRVPGQALVVESWIGLEGLEAAKAEFEAGHYRYIITSGGLSNNRWERTHDNYAAIAHRELLKLGMTDDNVIVAPAHEAERQRTFETALAVRRELEKRGLHLSGINVFTLGVHARRSRLVFSKAMPAEIRVGVISWLPAAYPLGPWWHSSERAENLLKETVGYFFELLLNSGRFSNSPPRLT